MMWLTSQNGEYMDFSVIFFTLLSIVCICVFLAIRIWRSDWAKMPKENRTNPIELFLQIKKSPGPLAIFIAVIIMIGLSILGGTMIVVWDEETRHVCSGIEHGGWESDNEAFNACKSRSWWDTSTDNYGTDPTPLEGFATESQVGPDGPIYWIGYCWLSLLMLCGFGTTAGRYGTQQRVLAKAERAQLTIVRKLALDPEGVIEGRIILPEPTPHYKPTKIEETLAIMIPLFLGLMIGFTLFSIISEIFNPNANLNPELVLLGIWLISLLVVVVGIACWFTICTIMMTIPGEDESLIPQVYKVKDSETEESVIEESRQRETPVAMSEIIAIMEEKLASAVSEAKELRGNLVETQERVQTLEREIVNKDFDIIELEGVRDKIKIELEEKMGSEKVTDSKELSLQDSVMVGDNLFGSTKIDQQIVNDPEAIAKAAISAYRQGKEESGHRRPDILL